MADKKFYEADNDQVESATAFLTSTKGLVLIGVIGLGLVVAFVWGVIEGFFS